MKSLLAFGFFALLGVAFGYYSTFVQNGGFVTQHFDPYLEDEYVTEVDKLTKNETLAEEISKLSLEGGVPKIEVVNGALFDFGAMNRYTRKEHDFIIRNDGDGRLDLQVIETSCKCILGKAKKEFVFPGEQTEVHLEWISNQFQDDFSQHTTLKTNDPSRPRLELRVVGKVIVDVKPLPDEMILSRISLDSPSSTSTHIFSFKDPNLKILDHRFSNEETADLFSATFTPLDADSDVVKNEDGAVWAAAVELKVLPGLPIGSINQNLQVKTNAAEGYDIEIPIRGIVESDITLLDSSVHRINRLKNQLDLGIVAPGETITANLSLTVKGEFRDRTKFWIESDDVTPSGSLQASIEEPTRLKKVTVFPVKITIPADAEPVDKMSRDTEKNGRVIIQTNHPTSTSVVIYVRFGVEGI